jgi:hypothetical protein
MEPIKQDLILDDSQFSEAVQRSISGLNEISNTGDGVNDDMAKSMKKYSAAIEESTQQTKEAAAQASKLKTENTRVAEAQERFEKVLRRTLAPLRLFGVDVNKLVDRLSAVRARLIDKQKALDATSESLKTTTDYVERYGERWGGLLNTLSGRFPKATKAVVGGLRAIKVALISTGIGAIVVLVGLLISGLVALGNSLKGTTSELSKTERIAILFKATLDSLLGIVTQVKDNIFALINGVKTLKEAFGDSAKAISQWGTTAVLAAAELEKAAIATKNADTAQRTLSAAIALSKDELNKQREAAADNTKGIGTRVAAIQKAAAIEGSLEQQRIRALEETVKAEQARFRAAEITGKGQKEAAENAIAAQQELKLVQAEANARQRQDQATINALYREGGERLQQFRDQYAELLKDLNQRVSGAKIDQLTGVDRINAELAVALKAIDDFEKEAKIAAGKARQAFDGSGFVTLRLLAEKKAEQERLKFTSKANLERIEADRAAAGLRAQLIGESSDALFNTEEARNQAVLEADRKGLEDRLRELQRFYQDRGGIQSDAEKAELEQISIGIDLALQKEAEGRKKAQDRIISDQIEGVQLESEIQELQLSLIRQSGDKTLTLDQFIENERLKIAEDAATKRLALLTDLYGPDSPEVKLATAQLQVLRDTISRGPNPYDPVRKFLKDALKLDDDTLAFVGSQFSSAFSNITAAAETFTRIQIEQGQKRIEALTNEINETQNLLDRELSLKEQGYANDYTLYSENLARLTAERDRVAAENLEKEKKLANAQLAINAAQQVSEYTLAAVKLFSSSSSLGPVVGVALALGAIGILASTIAAARANAERFKDAPTFHEGGPVSGALHGFGGKQIEVEGREFVVRGDVAQRHGDFLKMLNDGRFQQMDLMRALSSRNDIGPTLRKMEKDREVIVSLSGGIDYGRMETMYQRALEDMSGKVIGYLQTRPVEKLDADGNIVKEWKEGNNIRRQRVITQKITKKTKAHA